VPAGKEGSAPLALVEPDFEGICECPHFSDASLIRIPKTITRFLGAKVTDRQGPRQCFLLHGLISDRSHMASQEKDGYHSYEVHITVVCNWSVRCRCLGSCHICHTTHLGGHGLSTCVETGP
jgi:hypothetical protein